MSISLRTSGKGTSGKGLGPRDSKDRKMVLAALQQNSVLLFPALQSLLVKTLTSRRLGWESVTAVDIGIYLAIQAALMVFLAIFEFKPRKSKTP